MSELTCQLKDHIQPFERELALRELRSLSANTVKPLNGNQDTATVFEISGSADVRVLRQSLAYWHSVGIGANDLTDQVRAEATSVARRGGEGTNGTGQPVARPRKGRCLRYATHGIHEYRGKFFPQLVRSLINMAAVPLDGVVVDPMCGSGTTLVEARLMGRTAFGFDLNPLSVFIADVKCRSLSLSSGALSDTYRRVSEELLGAPRGQTSYFDSLPQHDQDYLRRWFAPSTLIELDHIRCTIDSIDDGSIRNLFLVFLSNILREVSWQKDDDLRVRREVHCLSKGEVVQRYLQEAARSARVVGAFTALGRSVGLGSYSVREGDARDIGRTLLDAGVHADAVVTSPPYATALPYIDTDRLSLVYLGLLPRSAHRARDAVMIGNREVTVTERSSHWIAYERNRASLPAATCRMIDRIATLNEGAAVGFRRRNLAALLSKYFLDMRDVLGQVRSILKPRGALCMVVGNNRTVAGGQEVAIRTVEHLVDIAKDQGLHMDANIDMDMLVSKEIFRKNAIRSEHVLMFKKSVD